MWNKAAIVVAATNSVVSANVICCSWSCVDQRQRTARSGVACRDSATQVNIFETRVDQFETMNSVQACEAPAPGGGRSAMKVSRAARSASTLRSTCCGETRDMAMSTMAGTEAAKITPRAGAESMSTAAQNEGGEALSHGSAGTSMNSAGPSTRDQRQEHAATT